MPTVARAYTESAAAFVMATAALRTAYRHDRALVAELSRAKRKAWRELIDALDVAAEQLA